MSSPRLPIDDGGEVGGGRREEEEKIMCCDFHIILIHLELASIVCQILWRKPTEGIQMTKQIVPLSAAGIS